MIRRILIAVFILGASFAMHRAEAACASGFIQITDPFLNPNNTPWSGSIVYTLAYNTTVAGSTIVGGRQQFNVTSGINICLAPGLYTPVSLQQSGISYGVTNSWAVPTSGGPYTVAQIQGNITLLGGGLLFSNTVSWSNAQTLALQTTAQQLVPALGANVIIVPVRMVFEIVNSFYTSNSQVIYFGEGTLGSNTVVGDYGALNPNGDAKYITSTFFQGTINANYLAYVNQPLIAYTMDAVSQMGGTGGNVYVTTWYYTFTVQ